MALVEVVSLFSPDPDLRKITTQEKNIIVSSHVLVFRIILNFSGEKEPGLSLLCPCSCGVLNCDLHWLVHFFSCVLNNLCCKTYSIVMIPDFLGALCEDTEVLVHYVKPSVVVVAEKLFLLLKALIKSS